MHGHGFWDNPKTWIAIAFVLFVAIFGRTLWRALSKMLDDRAAAVRAELEEAQRLRREAEVLLQEARAKRETALAEAQRMLESAKAQAAHAAEAASAEAEAGARRREQMAIDRIAAAEKAAVDEVRIAAAEIATQAAQAVIGRTHTAEADARLIDQAINQLPSALVSRRAA